jgi:cellulose synthase (UDP-forming)
MLFASNPRKAARREVALTRCLIALTVASAAFLALDLFQELWQRIHSGAIGPIAEQISFIAIAAALLYGNLVFQATRVGAIERRSAHRRGLEGRLDRVHDEVNPPALAILVPAYREEPDVVRRTLISAALQEHPRRRVVLLLDDPPQPRDLEAAAALVALRRLPRDLADLFEKPAVLTAFALAAFEVRARAGGLDRLGETQIAAALCAELAVWFESQADSEPGDGHAERWFRERILRARARDLDRRRIALEARMRRGRPPETAALLRLYRRLAALFRVEITSFERKRYANLSHTANKAMNLNAYLGLLGRSLCEVTRADGVHLVDAPPGEATRVVPTAEFVITLDADSLLAPEYARELLARIRAPGAERIAVIQTPYSAFPHAPGVLERVAGATTDVQYSIHQGFTRWDATYWVGANALLRTAALREIATHRRERGFDVPVFIQDRTVIEDTESSVDLIGSGWTLHNVPERLAWSATPPDFGSLVIQRRRWANGGLLILPKLLRALARGPWSLRRLAEGSLRVHYLTSIAMVNVSLVALLVWPFDHALRTLWFPLAALPYFVLYGRDLVQLGYPGGDLLRAYALNLLLVPVNLSGVGRSLVQAVSGRKSAFARTPKVTGRTAAPAGLHATWLGGLVVLAMVFAADLRHGHVIHAIFVAVNGAALGYGLHTMVGWRNAAADLLGIDLAEKRALAPRPPASLVSAR